MSGELNGTAVALAVETVPAGGTFLQVGGLLTNSFTLNNGSIDITNKSNSSWRNLLAGEGLQSVDISAELIFNSDANFTIVRAAAASKAALNYEIDRGGVTMTGAFYITSWAESAPDNDKLTVSVSMQSTGTVTGI
jgi:TP901-1 family phage major tail protein